MNFIKGDIIAAFKTNKYAYLLHQANCQSIMGSGVAGALVREWPWLAKLDEEYMPGRPGTKFGSFSVFGTNHGEIVNIYGQFNPGGVGKGLDTFEKRCEYLGKALAKFGEVHPTGSIIMPYIASGIASDSTLKKGMSDKEYFIRFIMPIVEESLPNREITVIGL